MTANITTTATTPLLRLLQVFDAESLGEGDLVAGANVLAAMCASLANLHPPGSSLISPEGNRLPVGMSFVTAGGLTNSLVGEQVLNPIGVIQNNVGDHLAADAAHAAAKLAAMPPQERHRNRPPPPANDLSSVGELQMDLNTFSPASDSSPFQSLLGSYRHQGLGELAATPAVFLCADGVDGLEKQLLHAHRRYPFIRAVLTASPGTELLERILLSVVRGSCFGAASPVHVRGHVAASCTASKLAESAGAGEEALANNMMWLIDGNGCPLSLEDRAAGDALVHHKTHLNYAAALQRVWAKRLDYRSTEPASTPYNWKRLQWRWLAFLQKLEARCPGLTFAARPLFATLVFGLNKLALGPHGGEARWSDTDALGLAEFLAGRMVQCREQSSQVAQNTRELDLAIKMVSKLEAGPLDARGIVRKTNRLLINDCRKVLGLYERLGVASRDGDDRWQLTLPVAEAVERIRAPQLTG